MDEIVINEFRGDGAVRTWQGEGTVDWAQRPFFLRFHTEDRAEREAVFRELCEKVGMDASTYLKS